MKAPIAIVLLLATACGGRPPKSTTSGGAGQAANAPTSGPDTASAPTECPEGTIRVGAECNTICDPDQGCANPADQCLLVEDADEREIAADDRIGPILEPVYACGIDH